MQKIRFPFTFIGKAKLGKIYRPYAVILIFSKLTNKWLPVEMVVDSGADYTLFPKRYAQILGIDINLDCLAETTLGVGGIETVYQYKRLPIKIDSWKQEIPVGFLERDDVPSLLGRLECLEKLRLTFADKITIFEM